jgi:hypothetical protein
VYGGAYVLVAQHEPQLPGQNQWQIALLSCGTASISPLTPQATSAARINR